MRAFIALELPKAFEEETASLAKSLSATIQGRFMKRETYHLTLAFLGNIDESTAAKTIQILNGLQATAHPLMLNATGLGKFGRSQDATLYLEIQKTDALMDLTATLRNELMAEQIPFDQKRFLPHITLARRAKIPHGSLPALMFPASEHACKITLYKSTLTQEGAHYKALYSIELA